MGRLTVFGEAARARLLLGLAAAAMIAAAMLLLAALNLGASALAAPTEPQANEIDLVMTVGTNPAACAVTKAITLPVTGGSAIYCYTVRNDSGITFRVHTLVDSRLGTVLADFPYVLGPGASAFLTMSAFMTGTAVSTATWWADAAPVDIVAQDTDSVTVTVIPAAPAVVLDKTVGTDPAVCAASSSITLPAPGGTVYYCYTIANIGNVALTRHTVVDDRLGTLLLEMPYSLAPGASAFFTQSATITITTLNTARYTGSNPAPAYEASDNDQALVTVIRKVYLPLVRR